MMVGWPSASSPTRVDSAAPTDEPPAEAFAPALFQAMRPSIAAGVVTSKLTEKLEVPPPGTDSVPLYAKRRAVVSDSGLGAVALQPGSHPGFTADEKNIFQQVGLSLTR
jgi:hypothetical protein